ncbi:HEAT repeat domain-containing protein [Planococcus shenhongbingii]|uniref:HEAT repeat domain-containing protein n=1 Tax=Planococcus shenhongbingii TaxID=3058398 RepID=UPI002617DF21|nr:HEAT repeat domain-containing protein [Planococcus sp. N016]WKA57693.1 HEAT repeat domain-containing protein [Planococcus sp. N016]
MVDIFLWVIGILLAFQFILLVGLIIWKTRTLSADQKLQLEVERLLPQYRKVIKGTLTEQPELPAGVQFQAAVIERILDILMSEAEPIDEKLKVAELAEENLSTYYKKVLKKGKWAERINALYFIEDFRMFSLREGVELHFKGLRKQDEEYRQSLRASAILQNPMVIDVLVGNRMLSVAFIKEILFRLDENLLTDLSQRMALKDNASENLLFAFLTINGEQKNKLFFPFVEKMMLDERKEVRIKAMKSLCNYEKLEDPSKLSAFFKSEFWEERMYAAKLTGACGLNEFKESLIELFSDPVWWVRFAAAENIYGLEDGTGLLKHIGATSEDAYARDIAKHMLTRKGGESQ